MQNFFLFFLYYLQWFVCFRYYIKILKREVNIAEKKSKYIQMVLQMMTNEKQMQIMRNEGA